MNQSHDSGIKNLYIVFSKGFFVSEVLDKDGASLSEPFRSSLNSLKEAFNKFKDSDYFFDYLNSGEAPFWERDLFVPNVGKVTYNHRKNVTGRLLLGDGGSREKFSYTSSVEFSEILHLPLLMEYKKKIITKPTANEYLNKLRRHNPSGRARDPNKKVGASQQNRMYIHFYPYGLCFIHLSVSIDSMDSIRIDDLIKWLRAVKVTGNNNRKDQVLFRVGRKFQGSLDDFFDYLWSQVSKSVFENKNQSVHQTPIYDSIRIKPASRIRSEDIDKYSQIDPSISPEYADLEEALCAQTRRNDIVDRLRYQARPPDDLEAFLRNIDYLEFEDEEVFASAVRDLTYYMPEYLGMRLNIDHLRWIVRMTDYSLAERAKHLYQLILRALREELPVELSTREVAGLLSKAPNWQNLRADKEDYQSVFGMYKGDFILPKSQSTVIVTNVWCSGLKFQLLFHWQLIAVWEIAYAQKLIISYYIDRLKKALILAKEHDESGEIKTSTLGFLHGLINLPNHLAPNFRKWYYKVADAIGLPRRQEELRRALEKYEKRIHLEQKLLETIEQFDQTRTIVDLREAIIRQIQIGDYNTMIIEDD